MPPALGNILPVQARQTWDRRRRKDEPALLGVCACLLPAFPTTTTYVCLTTWGGGWRVVGAMPLPLCAGGTYRPWRMPAPVEGVYTCVPVGEQWVCLPLNSDLEPDHYGHLNISQTCLLLW